jgi:hypothetical protein
MDIGKSKKRHARSEPVGAPLPKRPKTEKSPVQPPKRSGVDILLGRQPVSEE